ncbi:hypothetical protein ACQ1Q1_06730 [Ornithobacterium rhinotracheale]
MEIIPIFVPYLYAIQYKDCKENEYDRLLELWNDTDRLIKLLNDLKEDIPPNKTKYEVAQEILKEVEYIDDLLIEITETKPVNLDEFFQPLYNQEYYEVKLSLRKGKVGRTLRTNYLRVYAIRIDEETYIITGGAIKMHRAMQDRVHTHKEN